MIINDKYKIVIASILGISICFAVGLLSGYIQTSSLSEWYPFINKSYLSPPNLIFPIAWSIIYLLNSISFGIVWSKKSYQRTSAIALFFIQLAFNFLWSVLFFYLQSPALGLVDILLLVISLILYMKRCKEINVVAYWLNMPYLFWLMFAVYLNFYVVIYN